MEALRDDIRSRKTLGGILETRDIIIDCAKNIKSNDTTFKISTLPEVSDQLTALMSDYIDAVQKLEATQGAFMRLDDEMGERLEENDADQAEVLDMDIFDTRFQEVFNQENQNITGEAQGMADLDAVLRPSASRATRSDQTDEDIQVESPSRQIPKDPITKKNIKVAVRSTTCNHIYDRGSIESYFEQKQKNKSKVQCPVAGCQNRNMKKTELIDDDDTNNLITSIRERRPSDL